MSQPPQTTAGRDAVFPPGIDRIVLSLLLVGFFILYVPSYLDVARTVWTTDEQGHGPIILAVSLWLLYNHRHALAALPAQPAWGLGLPLLVVGLVLYVLGRSQSFLGIEVGSQIVLLCALTLGFLGKRALRLIWFPLFFLAFMTPLPEVLVASVTAPLKSAVSTVSANLLYALGYPVSRAGVILNVGQYQLLVADACAGLNSMFTLEALGLLYMNLMQYTSVARNVTLSILVIPIAFFANVVRVIILVLVTYHFGDAAGQGFVHGFAGMVLFLVGLVLVLFTDYLLGWFFKEPARAGAQA
ncbi:exosortase B [Rhodoferax sp. AJA081-3]|uniref:exosortase B n=1 Tax=Rhodoferax sp. AJA081-3 TaxID=2752316 RepID=UPI001AE07124|nr:exosortase B [Rhodoferax sp. AJA081-3]QTN26836.1 exosortase B [Rhodoferax sp. AJA081-3]